MEGLVFLLSLAAFVGSWVIYARRYAYQKKFFAHLIGFSAAILSFFTVLFFAFGVGLITPEAKQGQPTEIVISPAIVLLIGLAVLYFAKDINRSKNAPKNKEYVLSYRPGILTKEERKKLKSKSKVTFQSQTIATTSTFNQPIQVALPTKPSRAIRTGWTVGDFVFAYEDAEGNQTYRTVTAHSVTSIYIKGECWDRKEERTFRIDRIQGDIVDLSTGEILSVLQFKKLFI